MLTKNKKSAFTLVELLVVIAIIGLIASLSVIALGSARQKSRDSKRVSDIKQVQTALELFFSDQGRYPTVTEWNTGSLYATSTLTGTTTYMDKLPTASTGGTCNNNYTYAPNSTGDNYTINFCLEDKTGALSKGINFAKAGSVGKDPNLVGWWDFENTSSTTVYDNVSTNHCTWNGAETIRYAAGKSGGYAGYFNGAGSYLRCGESPALFPLEITLSAWAKHSYIDTYNGVVTNKTGTIHGINLMTRPHEFGALPGDGVSYQYVTSYPVAPVIGSWDHLVVTNKSGVSKFYLNGVYKGYNNMGLAYYVNSTELAIGCFYLYTNKQCVIPFFGNIDDVRVYNRALSDDEVLAIYNSTK